MEIIERTSAGIAWKLTALPFEVRTCLFVEPVALSFAVVMAPLSTVWALAT